VGLIGTGGRCRALMKSLARVPDVRLAAVCDVYDTHLDLARKLADPRALATKKYKEVLDRKDIDAVLIGSPDHWHVQMTVDACAAGKDVYVEKPLTHSLEEGRAVIEAQNKHGRVVQVGTQQRSMPQFQKARELIRAGRLGKVHKVHLTWNRNTDRVRKKPLNIDPRRVDWKAFLGSALGQPFDEYRFRNWRWFWDFGGGIFTDLMVHFIDVVHWFLDVEHPLRATAVGDHYTSKGVWQTPDTVQTLLTYPDFQAYFEGTHLLQRPQRGHAGVHGHGRHPLPRPRPIRIAPRARQGRRRGMGVGHGPARAGLLRQAGRGIATPDQLGRVRPQPQAADGPRRGGRERRVGGPPRQPGPAERAGRGVEGVTGASSGDL
jgi:predicted dehydrogenase